VVRTGRREARGAVRRGLRKRNGKRRRGAEKQPRAGETPKIVILSDIHGNYEALKALPEDYDELWVLGDLVNYGPQPAEVVEFVRQEASLVVRGNHDDAVAFGRDPRCSRAFREAAEETCRYTTSVLSDQQKGYLADLPYYRWVQRGGWTFYLCHAVPSDPLYVYCGEDDARWRKELAVAGTDFLFVGHRHIPFALRDGEQVVANPGSIGQPKDGRPLACYAVWENGSVFLRSYSYPVERTAKQIRAMAVSPEVQEFLIGVLQTGTVSKSSTERAHVKNQGA
jgi:predicted phosphodiesterase